MDDYEAPQLRSSRHHRDDVSDSPRDHAIRIALLEQSMDGIKLELHQINGNIGKLVWAVILAIVMAFIQFVIKGGLNA